MSLPKLIALSLLIAPFSAQALTVYVAPKGSDSAAGSKGAPLASVGKALAKLRASGESQREVKVEPGTYFFEGALDIGAGDSGRPGRPLKITGTGPGVVFSGFKPLSPAGWRPVEAKEDLDRLGEEVRSRVIQYRFSGSDLVRLGRITRRGFDADDRREVPPAMLHVGCRPMTIARWPNDGNLEASKVLKPGPVRSVENDEAYLAFWEGGGQIEIESDRPSTWAKPEEAWVNGRFGYAWEWSVNRVKSVAGRAIELAYGEVNGIGVDEARPPAFYFENVLEELDRPGEYYLDSSRGILFFLLPEGADVWKRKAQITWCEDPIVRFDGASHVMLSNVQIEGGRAEGIVVERGMNIAIEGVTVCACSGDGIVADGREIRIEGLLAENLGGGGVVLRGGDAQKLRTSGHRISRSRFVDLGRWDRAWRPALDLHGVGHKVRDCEFAELPHMAIEASGNDFSIEGCWFNNTCTDFGDMCAIYFNQGEEPHHRGTVITGNLFQNIGVGQEDAARGAVYMDNGSMGVTITDNVFHRVGEGDGGWTVMNHGGAHVRVEDNIFIDCPVPLHVGYWWATYGKGDLPSTRAHWKALMTSEETQTHRARYPELKNFLSEERVHPTTNTFSGNRIANRRRPLLAESGVSVFGGPRRVLKEAENDVLTKFEGLSFDSKGRPVIPGARPWKSAEVSVR